MPGPFDNRNPFAAFELAEHLRECIEPYLEGTTEGLPERSCTHAGAIADDCDCGQLIVAFDGAWETAEFPTPWSPDQRSGPGACGAALFALQFTVSILRCAPIGDGDQPPTCQQLSAAARIVAEDAWAVRAGLSCCLCVGAKRNEDGVKLFERWTFGTQSVVGPRGGCQGSEMTVIIGVKNGGYPCDIS